ncbi:MAG TPA: hypothetical protein VND96_06485 [Candidatus Micrarchaeaceae archaeon]|nr:hypothetical protein [Candidatus Micrarchaeaceae archaeon]
MSKALATDQRVPRGVRPAIALSLLPWPGPFDEILLVAALVALAVMRPGIIQELWREAA